MFFLDHDDAESLIKPKQCILISLPLVGNTVTYTHWSIAEASISTVCICLPNMAQLFQRARHHGMGALFTRREFLASSSGSRSKPGLHPGSKGGFRRIIASPAVIDDDDDDPLIGVKGVAGFYSVSASAQRRLTEERDAIALGQVHLRHDVSVEGG